MGELPLEAQSKLLRVLQEHEFERVGGTRTLRTDVRLIAATNRNLGSRVAAGEFRPDLFYRLNVFPVTVPALRERRDDIPLLVRHFARRAARKLGRPIEGASPAFLEQAMAYDWPGNVRELENAIERAAILAHGPLLDAFEVFAPTPAMSDAPRDDPNPAQARVAGTLEEVERAHIQRILEQTQWVIEGERGAALTLGINASTLRGRMRKLGIRRTR